MRRQKRCQPACKPGSVRRACTRVMAIHLGRALPRASSNQPGRRSGNGPEGEPSCRPYSVLLPVGFAVPRLLPAARCALTAPFHPYPACKSETRFRVSRIPRLSGRFGGGAVCFLWHFPWGRPRRTLSGTVFPWSPDFPPRARFERSRPTRAGTRGGHPAG